MNDLAKSLALSSESSVCCVFVCVWTVQTFRFENSKQKS
jgi:hypothetical protein